MHLSNARSSQSTDEKTSESDLFVVGIGASAGGIQALKVFFENVHADSGMAYVVILHLSPDHDSLLAEVLQTVSPLPVIQVKEKIKIEANHVYVIPPNQHLKMEDGWVIASPNLHVEDRRAPVDIFFRSLAESHRLKAICVVLSGSGANGSMGLKRVKELGGAAFVQHPQEAEFSEMPRSAIATKLVDEILPVEAIPDKIITYKNSLGTVHISVESEKRPEDQQQALREIFTQLRLRTGNDFSNYKRPTLLRRIERRINIRNLPDLPAYSAFLKENPDESTALLKDLLISVTNFFRDKQAWDVIETQVLPQLLKNKTEDSKLRIWIAGCATGEEAYSIAMLCAECTLGVLDAPKVQIFATDIDEAAISHAREGLYSLNDAADVSPERLRRFFSKEGDSYRIRREVREMVMFAHHNFIKDPPFSHLDIITCRNVFIYLNHIAQERVAETFHFALEPGGYLFLGSSETVDGAADLYTYFNREHHIFQTRQVQVRSYPVPESVPILRPEQIKIQLPYTEAEKRQSDRLSYSALHQRLLEEYAPPSIVINSEYDTVHISEQAGRFLQFSGGELSQNLLKLIRPELRLELRSALFQAMEQQLPVKARPLMVQIGDKTENISIHVRPVLRQDDLARGFILVLFETAAPGEKPQEAVFTTDEPVSRHLEEELARIKIQLRSTIEQYEFQGEELKASNEELQAINEELRSAAEELETSKEELQSINEELRTVNQELKEKIDETSLSSNNLQNLIYSTDIGTIFLDRNLRVKMFTPTASDIFNLISADYGRPLTDITHKLTFAGIDKDAEDVLANLQTIEREVWSYDGQIFLMRILPYRTAEDLINGVVLTFINITGLKKAEEQLRSSEQKLKATIASASDYAIITTDIKGIIEGWNTGAERLFGFKLEEAIGQSAEMIFTPEDRAAGVPATEMKTARETGNAADERWYMRKDGSRFFVSGVLSPIQDSNLSGYVKVMRDMTERQNAEAALRLAEERYRIVLESAGMGAWDWNIPEDKVIWNNEHYTMLGADPEHQPMDSAYFLQFIHPDDAERVKKALFEAIASNGTYHCEFRIIRGDNKEVRWMDGFGRVAEVKNGKAIRMVGVMTDITVRRAMEQQKDDFIGIASHELKTPVTSIKAYAQILQETFEQTHDSKSAKLMEKLDVQVDRLTGLISNLLDTTKLAEGQLPLHLEHFDFNDLLIERIEDLQRLSLNHHLILEGTPVEITADRERIGQVITNLVSNAIKYSPNGGDVIIKCREDEQSVFVSVEDKGIGIPEEMQRKVFDRFFRVKNPQVQTFQGLGLGLYITAGIIHRHNGTIQVDSQLGKGITFSFTLPKTQ